LPRGRRRRTPLSTAQPTSTSTPPPCPPNRTSNTPHRPHPSPHKPLPVTAGASAAQPIQLELFGQLLDFGLRFVARLHGAQHGQTLQHASDGLGDLVRGRVAGASGGRAGEGLEGDVLGAAGGEVGGGTGAGAGGCAAEEGRGL